MKVCCARNRDTKDGELFVCIKMPHFGGGNCSKIAQVAAAWLVRQDIGHTTILI